MINVKKILFQQAKIMPTKVTSKNHANKSGLKTTLFLTHFFILNLKQKVGQIMCLCVDFEKTKKLLKSKKKEFVFYKIFEEEDDKLFSLYRHAKVDCVNELPEFKKNVFNGSFLEGGAFHAYLTKKKAIYIAALFLNAVIILPIHVKKEHIVAVGIDEDVCLTQYEIKKRTYKQALKTDRFTYNLE